MIAIPGLEHYPGGKGSQGTYQTIINYMPPHATYIEPFLGAGKILRAKRPAKRNVGLELNEDIVQLWLTAALPGCEVRNDCGIQQLKDIAEHPPSAVAAILVYADPPYVRSSRKSSNALYKYEWTNAQHKEFLSIVTQLQCMVAISGYATRLYEKHLREWNKVPFTSQTRSGTATEVLYMNYPTPERLHDYSFIGTDRTERQQIKRKIERKVAGLLREPTVIRNAILHAIDSRLINGSQK